MFAIIRADAFNLPLYIHVLGAMLLVGSLFTVALTQFMTWSRGENSVGLRRLGFRTVLLGVFPSYLLMRVGGEWLVSKEHLGDVEPTWLSIGYSAADAGALLVLILMGLAGLGLRDLRKNKGLGAGRSVAVVTSVLVATFVVVLWAMTTKPV